MISKRWKSVSDVFTFGHIDQLSENMLQQKSPHNVEAQDSNKLECTVYFLNRFF